MYSRSFSDKPPHLPPQYGGTALKGGEENGSEKGDKEEACSAPKKEECEKDTGPQRDRGQECAGSRPPPPPARGLLSHLLPFDIKGDDLLLLGLALLLLNDGCEDEYLPLILLFLLIIH